MTLYYVYSVTDMETLWRNLNSFNEWGIQTMYVQKLIIVQAPIPQFKYTSSNRVIIIQLCK